MTVLLQLSLQLSIGDRFLEKSLEFLDGRPGIEIADVEDSAGRMDVLSIPLIPTREPMDRALTVVLRESLSGFIILSRDTDLMVTGESDVEFLPVQDEMVEMEMREIGLVGMRELDHGCVPLVEEDLHPHHISVHSEQHEEMVWSQSSGDEIVHEQHCAFVRSSGHRCSHHRDTHHGWMMLLLLLLQGMAAPKPTAASTA